MGVMKRQSAENMTWLQCLRSSTERQVHKSTDSYGEEFLMNKVASTVAHSSGARNMYRLLHFLQDVNFVNNFTTAQSSYRTREQCSESCRTKQVWQGLSSSRETVFSVQQAISAGVRVRETITKGKFICIFLMIYNLIVR